MDKISVSPKLLKWASDRSSTGQAEIEKRCPKFLHWLSGEDSPTLRQLEDFSKATATPLGFLFLKEPPVVGLGIPHYRTTSDKTVHDPSTELIDTLHLMQRRQAWLHDYLVDEGREKVRLVNCANQTDDVAEVAEKIRRLLGLEAGWARQEKTWEGALERLQGAITEAGVVVVFNGIVGNNTNRPLNVDEFRGFVLVDEYAPLVFVNASDSKSAQMFTLAHELAHVVFGVSAAFDLQQVLPASSGIERACNQVAAEFLVPETQLRKAWNPDLADPFNAVARTFKVSPIVAARRVLDLKLISREVFFEFYQSYMRREQRVKEEAGSGGNFHAMTIRRVGKRFAQELVTALAAGRVSFIEAYRLAGVNGNTFNELARRVKGE